MTVWERRDLPVLLALATSEDEDVRSGFLSVDAGTRTEKLGLELDGAEVHDAILTLADAGYVEAHVGRVSGGGAMFTRIRVTGRGQQALGEWPLFDEIASPDTLAALLERLAEEAPSEEEAANMRRAAGHVRTVGAGRCARSQRARSPNWRGSPSASANPLVGASPPRGLPPLRPRANGEYASRGTRRTPVCFERSPDPLPKGHALTPTAESYPASRRGNVLPWVVRGVSGRAPLAP